MKRDPLPSIVAAAPAPSVRAPPRPAAAPGWRVALPLLVVALLLIALMFHTTLASMVRTWAHSETFAHGFVVAPIALWLIWRMRDRLRALEPHPAWLAMPLLAAAGFAWLLGDAGAVNVVTQFAFVAMLVLAVPAIVGGEATRAMLFPLGFLFFCVPLGDFLLPTLMAHTADFTIGALRASGVPVYREGMQFTVPNGRWSIVEACSGVRYLIASLVVGTLFAYLNYTAMWRRLVFVGISIVVPIVANWVRAYLIVMLGYLSDNRIATGVDHIIYGWLFFGVVMLIMFMIGARWQQPRPIAAAAGAAPDTTSGATRRDVSPSTVRAAMLAVLVVTAIWPLADWLIERNASTAPVSLQVIEVPGWHAMPAPEGGFTPHFLGFAVARHEILHRGNEEVGLYVAYYGGQDFDHKLVSSENVLLRAEDRYWHAVASDTRTLDLGGATVPVGAARIVGEGGQTIEARQWYWIDGVLTSSDALAEARVAWLKVTGQTDDSAVVVIYTAVAKRTRVDDALQRFAHDAWPAIATALDGARGRAR